VLQDIYQSAEYCHPLLDSNLLLSTPGNHRHVSGPVNGFRCVDGRNFGAGRERSGRQAKSRRLVNGLVSRVPSSTYAWELGPVIYVEERQQLTGT
jgi:hypothetical protein